MWVGNLLSSKSQASVGCTARDGPLQARALKQKLQSGDIVLSRTRGSCQKRFGVLFGFV